MAPEAHERRLERLLARAERPDLALRLVRAALRVSLPGVRVDLLVRDAGRRWESRLHAPASEPPLDPWPPPPPDEAGPESARTWHRPLPPRSPRELTLSGGAEYPGDAELRERGYERRLLVPLRRSGLRAVVSASWRGEGLDGEDVRRVERIARLSVPALLAEARERRLLRKLERARSHATRARFVQRLTAGLHRSLAITEIFRMVVERLAPLVPFSRASLAVVTRTGRDLQWHRLERATGFRQLETVTQSETDEGVGRALAEHEPVVEESRPAPDVSADSAGAGHLASRAILPLMARRRVVGLLSVEAERSEAVRGESIALLRHVAGALALALENARLLRESQERTRLMTALYEVGQALGSAADRKDVTETVLDILHESFRFRHSAVLTLEQGADGGRWLVMQAARGYSARADDAVRIRVGDKGITSQAAETGELVYVPDVREDPRYIKGVQRGRSEVAVPLVAGGEVIGVFDVESTAVNAFAPEDLETLKLFGTQVALALHRASVFEEIRRQAMTDGLTGLLNQRYLFEKLERELSRSLRTGRPFSLALMDLDDLKEINDGCGHVVGNQVIRHVGDVLQRHVRTIDAAARFGGDEFALVLTEADARAARSLIERIQSQLREHVVPSHGPVTVSVGIAQWGPELVEVRDVVSAADEALYRAKSLGKDRACVAGDEAVGDVEPVAPRR